MPIQTGPFAPVTPFSTAMPEAAFDNLIGWAGQRVLWMKGHNCPCVGDTGSPLPTCLTCFGRGVYWDPALGPFVVLLTLITWIGRNVDIGDVMDPNFGMTFQGHPIVTIPATLTTLWTQTNTNDVFVQVDSSMRFQAVLRVGENQTVPAWHILGSNIQSASGFGNVFSIAPTGAVVVEDPNTNQPISGVTYIVSGGTVTLNPTAEFPSGFPSGTSYTVEYFSPVVLVIQENFGGLAHTRPFGQGITYPRRFKSSLLDLWLRDRLGSSTSITRSP